ncbi:hypothetical protein HRbin39_01096 [bacterium HR39]|nr:hypothetical protein HRbin39_01096 [bacterium HR39]
MAERLVAAGLSPVPHVAARRIRSHKELAGVLRAFREVGVRAFLVIAGDGEARGTLSRLPRPARHGAVRGGGHRAAGVLEDAELPLTAVHLYTFGGFERAARWAQAVRAVRFRIEGGALVVEAG